MDDRLTLWDQYVAGRISRGQLLKGAALAVGASVIPGTALADAGSTTGATTGSASATSFPFFPQTSSGTYTTESVTEIVSNMLTHMYLHLNAGVAILGTPALASKLGVTTGPALTLFQSFVAIHQAQIDFWSALVPGTTPVTSFTLDPKLLADTPTFIAAGEVVDTLRVATDITAAREFAELGQPTLTKYATQTAGVDGEIRVSIRYLGVLGGDTAVNPPTNKAFETDLLLYTRDGIAILRGLGLIGGTGTPLAYPGRDAVVTAAGAVGKEIIQLVPNNASSTVAVTGLSSIVSQRS